MSPIQRVILVEGFHDRAFVNGLLQRLGCLPLGASGKPPPLDPWGGKVMGGQYAFESKTKKFIRLMSIGGGGFEKKVRTWAEESKTQPIDRLLIVPDSALPPQVSPDAFIRSRRDAFGGLCEEVQYLSERSFSSRQIPRVDVGAWSATDDLVGLPPKQTLERLVCAAIATTHRDWFMSATAFVSGRPSAPPPSGKEASMTLMAGWFSRWGSDGFFEAVWQDETLARELELRLRVTETYEALEAVAN